MTLMGQPRPDWARDLMTHGEMFTYLTSRGAAADRARYLLRVASRGRNVPRFLDIYVTYQLGYYGTRKAS